MIQFSLLPDRVFSGCASWCNARKFIKKTMRPILGALFLFTSLNVNSQTADQYGFTASTSTFTPLVGGTTVPSVQVDDAISATIPLPFTFVFEGVNYSSFRVCSNGFITFNTTATNAATNNLNTTLRRPLLAPLWDDLNGNGGTASYQTSGTPGSQVFTFEFLNWKWNWQATAAVISFQVKLYEGTNVVEYIYRQEATAVNPGTSGGASIGLAGVTSGKYLSLNNTSASPTPSSTTETTNISTKPATDQLYRFTPPPACSGTPTAGTVNAPANACSGVNFSMSLLGATSGVTGLTYQWQSSSDNVTFNNITGATNATLTTANQTAATYYQCIITCTNGGATATTPSVQVGMNSFINCYCASNATNSADDDIGQVVLGSFANPATAPTPLTFNPVANATYTNFSSLSPTPDFALGQVYPLSVTQFNQNDYYTTNLGVYIDFNQDGDFADAGETVYTGVGPANAPTAGPHFTGNVTIPMTATLGNTRMRVVMNETGLANACGTYTWGETEDYIINITCPTLTSPTGIDGTVCAGATATLTASTSPGTVSWYDALTGGTLLVSGTSYTTPALSVTTTYYAETVFPGCTSPARTPVIANVNPVAVTIATVSTTCNGTADGTFNLTDTLCGTAPLSYSIDGGAFVTVIPTDLASGPHTVIVKDVNNFASALINITIPEPSSPINANAYNTNIYSADITWTPQGNETAWTVIYGPAGFDPTSGGTTVVATNDSLNIASLLADTDYEFYVTANCGGPGDTTGPVAFSTDGSYFVYDSNCGPGFTDISSTGTSLNTTDDSEVGMVFPFPFQYQDITLNNMTIGNNGGIVFETQSANVSYSIGGSNPNAYGLFPFVQDLATASAPGGVYTQVLGTAPNRKFIVQWNQIMHFFTSPSTVTFQVIFEETTNEIYFIYEDVDFGDAAYNNGADAEIGATGPIDYTISSFATTYLTNNSCVHFYNALCPNPTNLVSTVFQEEIQLDWAAGPYGETNWTIIFGPAGFDPLTSGTTMTYTSSDASLTGLTQLTNYDIYIYSECQVDNLTSPGLMVTLQTLPWCNNPTAVAGSVAGLNIDSVNVTWNWTAAAGAANPLSGFNIQYGETGFNLGAGTIVPANGLNYADTVTNTNFLAGGVYQGYVQAVCGTDTSNYIGPFTFVMPLSNDTVCGAELLQVDGTLYNFNNNGATVSTGEVIIAPPLTGYNTNDGWGSNNTPYRTTWFKFVAPASGSVRINMQTNSSYEGKAAVYNVVNCGNFAAPNFTLVSANDDGEINTGSSPNFTACGLTPGDEYYIMHSAEFSFTAAGIYSIKLTPIVLEAGTPTTIINACLKDTVNLFTTISGQQSGGTWSWVTPTAGLTDSLFNTDGSASQIFNFQYRVVDGCAYDSVIGQVRVYPVSSAGNDGTVTACRNEPVNLLAGLSGTADLGGTWYNPSNQTIASSAIVTANIPGQYNYSYIAGNGVCPNDTAIVLVNVLSTCNYLTIEELVFENMTVYPNPTTGVLFIANPNSNEIFNVEVSDLEGRVIYFANGVVNGTDVSEINLKDKDTGIYLVKVFNNNAEKTYRVVLK